MHFAGKLKIQIAPEKIFGANFCWPYPPSCEELIEAFKPEAVRRLPQGEYLPLLILDDLGVAARYRTETERLHSLLLYLATSHEESSPKEPFRGEFTLNGREFRRPVRLREALSDSAFVFNRQPSPVAIGKRISVELCPKFEFVGVVDIIWELSAA